MKSGEDKRWYFSLVGAFWFLGAAFVTCEAFIFTAGVKSCGSLGWGFYNLKLTPVLFVAVPWVWRAILLAFVVGGLLWVKLYRYSRSLVIAWSLITIGLIILTAVLMQRVPNECIPL